MIHINNVRKLINKTRMCFEAANSRKGETVVKEDRIVQSP